MKNSKFNILYEEVINSLNTNSLDQQYFNDCAYYKHDEPIKYNDLWIQIFEKPANNKVPQSKLYYFAYILDQYGVVKNYLSQVFTDKNECLESAQLSIMSNRQTFPIKYAVLTKLEYKYGRNSHTKQYSFSNNVSQNEFELKEQQVSKFITLLNENDLIKKYKAKYMEFLSKANKKIQINIEQLINQQYTMIDIRLVKSISIPFNTQKILFRLILPANKVSQFNNIFKIILGQMTLNEKQ